jgi:hypothetical protein
MTSTSQTLKATQIESFWRQIKGQEEGNVEMLKELIGDEVKKGCF